MTANTITAEDRLSDLGIQGGLTVLQRVAICFAAGVLGGLAVVLFSHVLFALGLSAALGVKEPVSLKSPDIYKPLFWGGLWGIPFASAKGCLGAAVPLRSAVLSRAGAGPVYHLPADERRGLVRASARRADVHGLPAAGQSAVRNSHRPCRKGDHWEEAITSDE